MIISRSICIFSLVFLIVFTFWMTTIFSNLSSASTAQIIQFKQSIPHPHINHGLSQKENLKTKDGKVVYGVEKPFQVDHPELLFQFHPSKIKGSKEEGGSQGSDHKQYIPKRNDHQKYDPSMEVTSGHQDKEGDGKFHEGFDLKKSALIFTMDSISNYIENSKRGGPKGEIIIRTSLEVGLRKLGVSVITCGSDAEFEMESRKISTSEIDFVFLDPFTWAKKGLSFYQIFLVWLELCFEDI